MKTIYYEAGIPAKLIPVEFMGWSKSPAHELTRCFNAVIRLKRSAPGYRAGEVLRVPEWCLVEKAGFKNYFQLVRPATLPFVEEKNLISSRI